MNYSYMSGTSMACPNAAGVAALIWSQYPDMTAEFVRQQLESTCDDLGTPGFDIYFGQGRVNAQKAIEQSPPNVELIADRWVPPVCGMLERPNVFNVTVLNAGIEAQTNIEVNLIVNGSVVDSASIPSLSPFSRGTALLSWTPSTIGTYNVTYAITPKAGEASLENNQLSKNYTVVAPPATANWTLLTTDPDEGTGYSLKAAYSQMQSNLVFFKVDFHHPWINAIQDINTGIMIDADRNISTGMPENFYSGEADCIGSDYMILVGNEGTAMWRWNQTQRSYDTSRPIDLLYLDAPEGSISFVVGVALSDLQSNGAFDCSFNDITDLGSYGVWDWMPNSGYVPFVPQKAQHDLVVTLETPRIWQPQETYTLTAKVFNFGQTSETGVNLKLYINGMEVNSASFCQYRQRRIQPANLRLDSHRRLL